MFNPNPRRPLTRRQTARIVVATAILAWATQTLVQQWGYGAEIPPPTLSAAMVQNETVERFVPPASTRPARIDLRSEATVIGAEVQLRQIARWSDADAATFAPVADLTLATIGPAAPFHSISMDEVKATLRDAGVNLASIHFTGSTKCIVNRSDVQFDESQALDEWINARAASNPQRTPRDTEPGVPEENKVSLQRIATDANIAVTARVDAPLADDEATASLRSILISDLCARLKLTRDQVQLNFKDSDDKLLSLARPQFTFDVSPLRVRDLGEVVWNIKIMSGDSVQKASIVATARAWQTQLITVKPLGFKQVIREDDVVERRTLADKLSSDPMMAKEQAVGQQASRDIKVGTLVTARLIDPVPLVRPGQFITITLSQGNIQVKTVARAMEGGSYGQTIRVKNETTKDIFEVVITGPQTAVVGGATELSSIQPQE
ncbi:MAG TPA: flagellar basal body P-ring formation chaperone FlgA [Tepidisphaeraceae bacterium]|nr:flagellar basal body P-ring formation chaperone FlgA [Tepidisphaeraceae bacterium]